MKPRDPSPAGQINQQLDEKVRQAKASGRTVGSATIEAVTPSGQVTVVVEDADRLGVLAGPITASRPDGKPSSVSSQAGEVIRRLTYLQEPLAIIETEDRRGRAILRSALPRQSGAGREYNEAVLDGGGSISIRRYRADQGQRRHSVPSNLSRDTLGRLADDLIDIVNKE